MRIDALPFNVRARNCLRRAGVSQLCELVQLGEEQLLKIPNLGRGTLAHIVEVLRGAGFGEGMNNQDARTGDVRNTVADEIDAAVMEAPIGVLPLNVRATNSLARAGILRVGEWIELSDEQLLRSWKHTIDALPISIRAWTVLGQRFGAARRLTLQEIAKQIGVTRERVRQIQSSAVNVLERAPNLIAGLDRIEGLISTGGGKAFGKIRTAAEFVSAVRGISDVATSHEDGIRLLIVVRTLTSAGIGEKLWRQLSYAASVISPQLEEHSEVRRLLVESARKRWESTRQWTYKELILHVLREERAPLHWREIAERCERLGRRRSFSASTCFNQMTDRRLFVRVGQGRYGLVEWGIKRSRNISDLIAIFLFEDKGCLSYGEILHRSDAIQNVKTQSIKMTLDLHPRFYRAISGKYGLRAWLPDRARQTLRTHEDLIEASDSSRRVPRAEARGYDVSRIVLDDVKVLEMRLDGPVGAATTEWRKGWVG